MAERSPALRRGLELCPLQRGDFVTYLARPEWGNGLVLRVEPNGLLRVRFADALPIYEGEFHAQELEMAHRVSNLNPAPSPTGL